MSLAEAQAAFMRAILDDSAPLPGDWGNSQAAGMGVYRGNYRSAVTGALAATFERTARYVGNDAFRRASIHHVLAHPPSHWTIDAVGEGFDATCAELFGGNPEVAEIAWLEWSMLEASRACDLTPLSAPDFAAASAGFADEDWAALKLQFLPKSTARIVQHDLTALWRSLEESSDTAPHLSDPAERGVVVWREGERPTFVMTDTGTARAFAAMQEGASYGEVVVLLAGDEPGDEDIQNAASKAGAYLGQWLNEGLVTAFQT